MIPFDPENPFPLLPLDSYSYKEAQDHSQEVDLWLGLNINVTEEKVRAQGKSAGQQNWEHLSTQAFQTPYVELRNILDLLQLPSGSHLVDLGCAYARMGFIIARHYSDLFFSGYELEGPRISETQKILNKWNGPHIQVHQQDLASSDFKPPEADAYFIFDYGSENDVRKTLLDLQNIARKRNIVVVARGRLTRFWIHKEHPWLADVHSPRHFSHFSIYSS